MAHHHNKQSLMSLLRDFPAGPLDYYRKQASFCWKKMKVFLDTEEIVHYQEELYDELQRYPEYKHCAIEETLDDMRQRAVRQAHIHGRLPLLSIDYVLEKGNFKYAVASLRTMIQLSPAASIKNAVGRSMFTNTIQSIGTARHYHFVEAIQTNKITGCFCLTEIGHGTNVKGMRTLATYDIERKQFIMHTPDFEAAKCWSGSLGQCATHGIIFAQLYVQGVHHGLHAFVVPLRDPETMMPYPGVTIGDMGPKIGLNGIDNGFVIFDNYPLARENLLNKTGDISENGEYVTQFKDPNKRHGASLGALSVGRVTITCICESYGAKALTIALRYSGVRRQFGPDGKEEIPILEYQTHQHRLIPYLAALYAFRIFSMELIEVYYQFVMDTIVGQNQEILPDLGMELHAISCGAKPLASWVFRDAIQECRETCGGHGYLKVAGIGDLKNDHDANCTYEGESHVLIQQLSNWILKYAPIVVDGDTTSINADTPLKSIHFMQNGARILKSSFFQCTTFEDMLKPKHVIDTFQWLICYLLRQTKLKLDHLLRNEDAFDAKNNCQVYYAKDLAVAFTEHYVLQRMLVKIEQCSDDNIKRVLTHLFCLYGWWSAQKHIHTLYEGGFAQGNQFSLLLHDSILRLCSTLKSDALALVDAIAPPDFILNSVLGASDGMVYKRLHSALLQSSYGMGRPKWWSDILHYDPKPKAKL